MKIDRCKNSETEEVNDELFMAIQYPNVGMTADASSVSCWIPPQMKDQFLEFVEGPRIQLATAKKKVRSAFIICKDDYYESIYEVNDFITFAGGDVLALMTPIAVRTRKQAPSSDPTDGN